MSNQDELDARTAELQELLGWIEALFPSLVVHGLHIISKDMTLFNKQYNKISERISDLPEEDQAIALKILHWFHHNYPHPEYRKPPSHGQGHPHSSSPASIFIEIIRREQERRAREVRRHILDIFMHHVRRH